MSQEDLLLHAAKRALNAMCKAISPDNEFTDAVDALEAAITAAESSTKPAQGVSRVEVKMLAPRGFDALFIIENAAVKMERGTRDIDGELELTGEISFHITGREVRARADPRREKILRILSQRRTPQNPRDNVNVELADRILAALDAKE